MNIPPPPLWLVLGSVLGCLFWLEYLRTVDTRTDFVTYYYPGQAELVKALTEDHAMVKVGVMFGFEALKGLDP